MAKIYSPVVVGRGASTLKLMLSADSYRGDALVAIRVDGVLVGTVQTIKASHSMGEVQEIDILGAWSTAPHSLSVQFLNDAYGGSVALDRNAYVNGAFFNGGALPISETRLGASGDTFFTNFKSGVSTMPGKQDITVLLSEDAYQGNANALITVDGITVFHGDVLSLKSSAGTPVILGSFDISMPHKIAVTFTNDVWGGTAATDRNLYVRDILVGGVSTGLSADIMTQDTKTFELLAGGMPVMTVPVQTPPVTTPVVIPSPVTVPVIIPPVITPVVKPPVTVPVVSLPSHQALLASAFTSSVAINTSITIIGSAYQDYANMLNALSYLGTNSIRDTYDNPYAINEFGKMAVDAGAKFDFFLALGGVPVDWQIDKIKANPGIVAYVEGYNEPDSWLAGANYKGLTGLAATAAAQKALYTAVKSTPSLSGVGVIQSTIVQPANYALYGDQSASTDYASTHTYFGTANPPGGSYLDIIKQSQIDSPGKPTITTEAGYHTTVGSVHGVDQTVQAKYELNLLMDQFKAGVSKTYVWELADNYQDPNNTNTEDHFGVFNADWTPKQAALAIHNLNTILGSQQTNSATSPVSALPSQLAYSLSGMPSSGNSLLLDKGNGTFDIVLWNDLRLSGPVSQDEIAIPAVPVTVALPGQYARISIYDPLLGTTAVHEYSGLKTVTVDVPDHPVIVEVSQTLSTHPASSLIHGPSQVVSEPGHEVQVIGLGLYGLAAGTYSASISSGSTLDVLNVVGADGKLVSTQNGRMVLVGQPDVLAAELSSLHYTPGVMAHGSNISVQLANAAGTLAKFDIATKVVPLIQEHDNSGGASLITPALVSVQAGASMTLIRNSISDIYAETVPGAVSLKISDQLGSLSIQALGALVTGNGTSSLALSGTYAGVSTALATLVYAAPNAVGTDHVSFSFLDQQGFSSSSSTTVSVITSKNT